MPKPTFRRLTTDQQVEMVEARGDTVRSQLHRIGVDYATLDNMPGDADRAALDDHKAALEGQVKKLDAKATALRGKAPSKAERDERDGRVAAQAARDLERLVAAWEQTRMQHLLNAETGVDPSGQPTDPDQETAAADLIAVRVDAAIAEIERLKA